MKRFKAMVCGVLLIAMVCSFAACGSGEDKDENGVNTVADNNAVQTSTNEQKNDNANSDEKVVDDSYKEELENLKTSLENLPDPKGITSPDVFLEKLDELADIYVEASEMIGKYGEIEEIMNLHMETFTEYTEWSQYADSVSADLPYGEKADFWDKYNKNIGRMRDALDKLRGEGDENK